MRRRLVAVALALLLLGGCSGSPGLEPLAPGDVVLAFGDSLTYGTGAGRDEAYPVVLASLIDRRVINAGVPGEESDAGLVRLPGLLEKHRPALVIISHGGNDILRRRDLAQTETNLREMVVRAREYGAGVVLVAVPEPRITMSPPDFYAAVAADHELVLEDSAWRYILRRNQLKSDPVHPNAEGYRYFAEALAGLLEEAGALAH